MFVLSFALIATAVSVARAATYTVSDTFIGSSFLTGFNHESIPDPTHGRTNYVTQATALKLNLTYASSDSLILRADSKTVLSPSGPGRNSVRIVSKKQWSTHVEIIDVRHMPQGCGTWPAYWTTSNSVTWPAAGEIDIIEGVNDQKANAATLHTTPGCTQPVVRDQTGITTGVDCNWQVNGNAGCGVMAPATNSYGPSFNANGGGWYAMERTTTYIKVWFWPRNSGSVPAQVKNGASSINTSTWGKPFASFVNTSCNIASKFGPENIIINLALCGDWAGNPAVYAGAGCPSTCVDHVNKNPAAFKNAYWDIAALRVYQ
ncbi:Endo-1,3(4)-beta-glucanase [Ceratobasidium theobromae]|uniref:Endo-1,3(4)-beta-glucanase n=1 Tax=Ceratobasidium theobromae TaxID=1582974 RepID=A0A5N5QKG9_9AGAM|nr:Endo-1,3(4)-beta-glucanase [Ceratobasidium theobromae]